MRLIDADALHVDYIFPTTTTGTTCWGYVSQIQINNAPTIKAVQERKGRWIFNQYGNTQIGNWHCSKCGRITIMPHDVYNYCPHCGAKMEGEQDDND